MLKSRTVHAKAQRMHLQQMAQRNTRFEVTLLSELSWRMRLAFRHPQEVKELTRAAARGFPALVVLGQVRHSIVWLSSTYQFTLHLCVKKIKYFHRR